MYLNAIQGANTTVKLWSVHWTIELIETHPLYQLLNQLPVQLVFQVETCTVWTDTERNLILVSRIWMIYQWNWRLPRWWGNQKGFILITWTILHMLMNWTWAYTDFTVDCFPSFCTRCSQVWTYRAWWHHKVERNQCIYDQQSTSSSNVLFKP